MPNYDYLCTKCGHRFEVFQKMTDPKLTQCPKCGGPVERLIGPGAGVVFKGSGFYQTDYRSDSYKQKAKAESGSPAETPKKDKAAGGAGAAPDKPSKSEATKKKADSSTKPREGGKSHGA